MSKQRLQSDENFIGMFYDREFSCQITEEVLLTEEECQQSVNECYAMLQYSLDRQDKDEIAFWRKMLQRAKVEKRSIASITA